MLLAIDPGPTDSAYVVLGHDLRPTRFGKVRNAELLAMLRMSARAPSVIEMIAAYGMAVGADVFETCVWIGRFYEAVTVASGTEPSLIKRLPVKLHHCHSAKAKDGEVAQALRDRFGGKGTKDAPGWFYGFAGDVWQAYALAVYAADAAPMLPEQEPVEAEAVLL